MDNNRDFFEQLAGVKEENEELEAELVRTSRNSSRSSTAQKDEVELLSHTSKLPSEGFEDAEGHLMIDVYQNDTNIIIESTIAGVDPSEIDVQITSDSVTIKGKREKREHIRKEDYLYEECFWGKFSRSIILPQEIDADKAQASLKDGLLKIVLPKVHKTGGKKIKVKLD